MARLQADTITLSYGGPTAAVEDLSLHVPDGKVTSIIGPNGCGKSTLLRALSRLMKPRGGVVLLDGQSIQSQPTKQVARQLGLLSQHPSAPESITVEDLVRRGRYPHQSLLQSPSSKDRDAVEGAIELTGMTGLRDRPVDELSGGQRQRAWIAMAIAQETPLLLLDEPTTYLDIAHQQEVLSLIRRLNQEEGRTVVLVLHDVNNAAQISDHVVAMRDGKVLAEGAPDVVLNPDLLEEVFDVACDIVMHPQTSIPISIPRSRVQLTPGPMIPCDICALRSVCLVCGYRDRCVIEDLSVTIPKGNITAIVGPNACGKSTLLRTFARLLKVGDGSVTLQDMPISEGSHRDFAQRLAFLAQGGSAAAGVVVEDLVAIGRYPYQRWYRQWSRDDQHAVDRAMAATGIEDLRGRPLETLSGGQRQRVWLAMALAQATDTLLLDEPTTFLDIAQQVEVLDLVWELNRTEGSTIVLVLHDLGQACRYADFLVAMKDGKVAASGTPGEVMTNPLMRDVFGVDGCIVPDPLTGTPIVLPQPVSSEHPVPGHELIGA